MNKSLLKKDNLIKVSKMLFYLGICLELAVSFSGFLFGGYHESLIIVAAMGCFSLSILLDFDIKRDWLLCIICGLYGLLCYYFQHSAFILRIVLAIIAGRRQNAKDVFKIFFWGTGITMILAAIASALGYHNSLYAEEAFRSVIERRYTFGFFHPNGYTLFLFRTFVMGLFVYIDKMNLISYIAYSIGAVLLAIPAKSKMGILMILVGITLFGIYKFASSKIAIVSSITSTVIVALYWCYIRFYDFIPDNKFTHDIWMGVDKITTGRSGDSYYAMIGNKATLFGVGFGPQTSEMGLVDSIYCQGIIFMVLFVLTVIWLYRKSIKDSNISAVIVIALTVLYSIAETFLQYFNKNMIWMLCIGVMFAIPSKLGDKNAEEDKD